MANLEWGKRRALSSLSLRDMSSLSAQQMFWVAVGLGYCVAKGWAVYKGGESFEITGSGRIQDLLHELDDIESGPEITIIYLPDLSGANGV